MLPTRKFKFLDSEYFYIDEKGWHLKKDAPDDLKKEFEEYKKQFKSIRAGDI